MHNMEKDKVHIEGHQTVPALEQAKEKMHHLEKVQPGAGRKKKHFVPLGMIEIASKAYVNP